MPAPSDFTPTHYMDMPLVSAGSVGAARLRQIVERAWDSGAGIGTTPKVYIVGDSNFHPSNFHFAPMSKLVFGNDPGVWGRNTYDGRQGMIQYGANDADTYDRSSWFRWWGSGSTGPENAVLGQMAQAQILHTIHGGNALGQTSFTSTLARLADTSEMLVKAIIHTKNASALPAEIEARSWYTGFWFSNLNQNIASFPTTHGTAAIPSDFADGEFRTIHIPVDSPLDEDNDILSKHRARLFIKLLHDEEDKKVAILDSTLHHKNPRGLLWDGSNAGGATIGGVLSQWVNTDGFEPWMRSQMPDVFVVATGVNQGGDLNADQAWDDMVELMDAVLAINPNTLFVYNGSHNPAHMNYGFVQFGSSIMHRLSLEGYPLVVNNCTRYLEERLGWLPARQTSNNTIVNYTEGASYAIGDVVAVTIDKPESWHLHPFYSWQLSYETQTGNVVLRFICTASVASAPASSHADHPANVNGLRRWQLLGWEGGDSVHPGTWITREWQGTLVRLLSGTFPDRTANELLGLTGGGRLGNRIWA